MADNPQVIEARNLNFPGNNVGPFGAVDAYASVFLETEAGVVTARTPSERRHLTAPKWQHDLSFPDAALSHSATFAVSCHRRLSSSIIVGQVGINSTFEFQLPKPCHCSSFSMDGAGHLALQEAVSRSRAMP